MDEKHKVFISYHHKNDQWAKKELLEYNIEEYIFIESLSDEIIREKIRDEYLQKSTVTILLVGEETKNRKHIDWEIYSSMYDGKINKKSGILVIQLPSTSPNSIILAHGNKEKEYIYPNSKNWKRIESRKELEEKFPYLPDRIIDNLLKPEAKISVVRWCDITADKLKFLIDLAFEDKDSCEYDMNRPMRKKNS